MLVKGATGGIGCTHTQMIPEEEYSYPKAHLYKHDLTQIGTWRINNHIISRNSLALYPIRRLIVKILQCLDTARFVFRIEQSLIFDRHLDSSVAEVPVKLQSDTMTKTIKLVPSRLHEILRLDVLSDIESGALISMAVSLNLPLA